MTWKELVAKWDKEGTYTENLTFICHMLRRKTSKTRIASFFRLDSVKELQKFAEADPNCRAALDCEDVVGHYDYFQNALKFYKGFEYKESFDEDYIDSDGKRKKRIVYRTKFYIPTFKDREYYGKKFVDPFYADQVEEYGMKTDLKESGKVKCLTKTQKKK